MKCQVIRIRLYPQQTNGRGARKSDITKKGVAENADQLFALCKEDGVNHLIYTGFAINGCLLSSPGGMMDMQKRGLLCSTIRQTVTAIENKETARTEQAKELALWYVALMFGFVYDLDELLHAVSLE